MPVSLASFQKKILGWYEIHGRHDLPWRQTRNPYWILVSEVMLQQTQVDRVIGKYFEFLKYFATQKKLSMATPAEVLRVWNGLGYNRRALYLHCAAQRIITNFHGRFPKTVSHMETLPGVGPYTARAVSVFAFNNAEVFIETNIRRVFLHFFFFGREKVPDSEIFPLIEKTLWRKDPRKWYNALMDYGAMALSDIPNPNHRSRHYTKQTRFEGSRRYARAKILDYLLQNKKAGKECLKEFFEKDPLLEPYADRTTLSGLLAVLTKEGFLMKEGNNWFLKQ